MANEDQITKLGDINFSTPLTDVVRAGGEGQFVSEVELEKHLTGDVEVAEFSTEERYETGDLVKHNGHIYRCSGVHEPGEWSDDDFFSPVARDRTDLKVYRPDGVAYGPTIATIEHTADGVPNVSTFDSSVLAVDNECDALVGEKHGAESCVKAVSYFKPEEGDFGSGCDSVALKAKRNSDGSRFFGFVTDHTKDVFFNDETKADQEISESEEHTIALPDKNGTIALTSDVSGKIDNPDGGSAGDVLKKTESGVEWGSAPSGEPSEYIKSASLSEDRTLTLTDKDGTESVSVDIPTVTQDLVSDSSEGKAADAKSVGTEISKKATAYLKPAYDEDGYEVVVGDNTLFGTIISSTVCDVTVNGETVSWSKFGLAWIYGSFLVRGTSDDKPDYAMLNGSETRYQFAVKQVHHDAEYIASKANDSDKLDGHRFSDIESLIGEKADAYDKVIEYKCIYTTTGGAGAITLYSQKQNPLPEEIDIDRISVEKGYSIDAYLDESEEYKKLIVKWKRSETAKLYNYVDFRRDGVVYESIDGQSVTRSYSFSAVTEKDTTTASKAAQLTSEGKIDALASTDTTEESYSGADEKSVIGRLSALENKSSGGIEEFSTTKTYAVGDIVKYGNEMYRCGTAVTEAGAWDASKWDKYVACDYITVSDDDKDKRVAIGVEADASGDAGESAGTRYQSTAVGRRAKALGASTTAVGPSAVAGNSDFPNNHFSVAIGYKAAAIADSAVAIGGSSQYNVESHQITVPSMGTGVSTLAEGASSIAIGGSLARAGESIAIGKNSLIDGTNNTGVVAIGSGANSESNSEHSIAIGVNAKIGDTTPSSIAIGDGAEVSSKTDEKGQALVGRGIAIGLTAKTTGMESVQFGPGTNETSYSLQFRSHNLFVDSDGFAKLGVGFPKEESLTDTNDKIPTSHAVKTELDKKLDKTEVVSPDSSVCEKSGKAADSGWVEKCKVNAYVDKVQIVCLDYLFYVMESGGEILLDIIKYEDGVFEFVVKNDECIPKGTYYLSEDEYFRRDGNWIQFYPELERPVSYSIVNVDMTSAPRDPDATCETITTDVYKTDTAPKAASLTPSAITSLFSDTVFTRDSKTTPTGVTVSDSSIAGRLTAIETELSGVSEILSQAIGE